MIKDIVRNLTEQHHTNNPFELTDCKNIQIIYHDLGIIRGIYRIYKRNKQMFINNTLSKEERRMVCAHELGHAILHKNYNTVFMDRGTMFNNNKLEIEANKFVAELLINDNIIYKYKQYTIEQIANVENVSVELVKYKFNFF